MPKEKWVTCEECGEHTPLKIRTDYLGSGIQHVYAVCQSCEAKVTVYYTDKEIRRLLKQQKKTPAGSTKGKLTDEINTKMQALRTSMEEKHEDTN